MQLIHRRKIATLLTVWISITVAWAQPKKNNIDPNRDFRKHYFWGIAFCATQAKAKIALAPEFYQRNDSLYDIKPFAQAGGGFGGTVAMRFGKFWEVKAFTMLQLHQRDLQFTFRDRVERLKIETISFDLPVNIKYRSVMPNNTRFYVLGGVRWSHDFQSNQGQLISPAKPLVAIKKDVFYYEYGCGFEFRLDFVDLGVELKMSNAINNALVRIPGSYYSGSLQSYLPRLFSISLTAQN